MTSESVTFEDSSVGVWRFGHAGGWPLIWCHGGLSCGADAALLDAAARRHGADVIALDRPGIGRSSPNHTATVASWSSVVGQVADTLHLDEFAVAGWSAGGPYALACAAAMPERVRQVATLAGMAPLEGMRDVAQLGLWADVVLIPAASRQPRIASALLRGARLLPDRYYSWEILRSAGPRDREALQGSVADLVLAVREATHAGVRGTVDDYRRFGGRWGFDLHTVAQPVTIWHGRQDTLAPLSHAQRLHNALKNSTLRIVASTGHYLPAVIAEQVIVDLAPACAKPQPSERI
jgi:pimeloyl-ACP methyl ester carboxylesterase